MATPPASITSITRSTSTINLKVIVGTRTPTEDNPSIYDIKEKTVTVGQTSATRRMAQKNNPSIFFEFTYPATQISYEGIGMDIQEIPRPLLKPLIDIKGKFNYKASFEFLVAASGDGLTQSVEKQLRTLEWMADTAEPVTFTNFDTFLNTGHWYIAQFSIKTSRVNTKGEIAAASCTIGLLEYKDTATIFSKFPKINYTNSNRKKTTTGTGGGGDDVEPFTGNLKGAANNTGSGAQAQGGGASTVTNVVLPKKGWRYEYRYSGSGTEVPANFQPPKTLSGKQLWTKEGNAWVLYAVGSAFPYPSYKMLNNKSITESKEVSPITFIGQQKAAYEISRALQEAAPIG